jgi:hypothetical protein
MDAQTTCWLQLILGAFMVLVVAILDELDQGRKR